MRFDCTVGSILHAGRTVGFIGGLAIAAATPALGATLHVSAAASAGGDGLTWATAMPDLQDALALAAADPTVTEIWVAEGRYVPSGSDATVSFVLRNGLALYGGFAGTERTLAERDPAAHVTILDGDLAGDDIVGSGAYFYANWNIGTSNAGHIVRASGTDASAVLDGFTLENGSTGPVGTPSNSEFMMGGGVYCVGGSPTIRNCTFRHCLAGFTAGAAVYLWNSNATVVDCRFIENYGHLSDGAGLFVGGASQPTIDGCLFEHNVVVASQPDGQGGGLASWSTKPVAVRRCTFRENVAKPFSPGGPIVTYGGGLFGFNQPLLVSDCAFIGNGAALGGGLASFGATTLVNCLLVENAATPDLGGQGAAAWIWNSGGATSQLIQCTVHANVGREYAVHNANAGTIQLRNSILIGNTATEPELAGGYKANVGGSFNAKHCCIGHIFEPSAPGEDPIDPENLPGCIDLDPHFVGPDDRRLDAGSPCIDAGSNAYVPAGVTTDLDGGARFIDDPDAPNEGVGSPPVDIGCYERSAPPPCVPADLDCDGAVDAADLAILLAAWGTDGADLDENGTVNAADLAILLASWG